MDVSAPAPRFSLGRSTPATLAIVALRSFHRRRPRRPPFERRLRRRNLSWGEVPEGGQRPPPGFTPAWPCAEGSCRSRVSPRDRKSTRLNSSHGYISYAVFCLKKKNDSTPISVR